MLAPFQMAVLRRFCNLLANLGRRALDLSVSPFDEGDLPAN
jgi:hypothetical protein